MLNVQWLQTIDYIQAWEQQKFLREQVLHGQAPTILGCEHFPILTRGKRVETLEKEIMNSNIEIPSVQTDRGGLVTLHNPGQLVIYPVFSLREHGLGVREWVELLLETTEVCLKKCNIILINKNNGLFTEIGKISSIGINISKGVSTHGIAINVCNDLSLFKMFDPCGIENQTMDKVANHSPSMTTEALFRLWVQAFSERLTLLN
ncbi:lipoyl(octanoyl) transferase LipB [bacterium]|nr:lipoyl(octanoyl) transferase LipB [bacterium]